MTTLEQMAVDVFSEGADLGYEAPFWVYFGEKDESEHETISVFEMAQLNDMAIEIWSRRICTDDFYEFVNDGPWRLEDE